MPESTSVDYATASDSYVDRAAGFGMPGVTVDGLDFFAVYEAAGEVIRRAREAPGRRCWNARTSASSAISRATPRPTKAPGENSSIAKHNDCLKLFRQKVTGASVITDAELDAIDAEVAALIDEAVAEAIAAPSPAPNN